MPERMTLSTQGSLDRQDILQNLVGSGILDLSKVIKSEFGTEKRPVTTIGMGLLNEDNNTTEVIIPDFIECINKDAFYNCLYLKRIHIGAECFSVYSGFINNCPSLEEITVDENNEHFKSIDGVLFSKDGNSIIYYPCAKQGETYLIPEHTKFIKNYSFLDNLNLKFLAIPYHIEDIGKGAFSRSLLKNVIIMEGCLSELNSYTFKNCRNLENITIPNSITFLGAGCFLSCTKLTQIKLSSKIRKLSNSLFENCENLKRVHTEAHIRKISENAFKNCYSLKEFDLPLDCEIDETSFDGVNDKGFDKSCLNKIFGE